MLCSSRVELDLFLVHALQEVTLFCLKLIFWYYNETLMYMTLCVHFMSNMYQGLS